MLKDVADGGGMFWHVLEGVRMLLNMLQCWRVFSNVVQCGGWWWNVLEYVEMFGNVVKCAEIILQFK